MHSFFRYLKKDIWHIHVEKLSKWKAFWIRFLRLFLLTSQGFTKRQIQQGASTLTYYTLLAIVPILALLIGLTKGFHLEPYFKTWLLKIFAEQKETVSKIFAFAEQSLTQVTGGFIALLGVFLLIWSALKILISIERVMNNIWEVKVGRSLAKRFSDYLAMLFLCPVFVLLSSATTVYLTAAVTALGKEARIIQEYGPLLFPVFNLIPYFLTWLLLTFIYIFMPNTRVRFLPALYAGIITGSFYQIAQWIYLYFQIGVSKYNAIYGTFAAIPLFLIWLHLSWVIILLGAKIAFSFQNVNAYQFVSEDIILSHRMRMLLSLRIAHFCVKRFIKDLPSPSANEISSALSIPLPLTSQLLYWLVDADVLSEVSRNQERDKSYQPAKTADTLTIQTVLDLINQRGDQIALPHSQDVKTLKKCFEEFEALITSSKANLKLCEIS